MSLRARLTIAWVCIAGSVAPPPSPAQSGPAVPVVPSAAEQGSQAPFALADVGGTLYFAAEAPGLCRELWRSSGAANTVPVRDGLPGFDWPGPAYLTNIGPLLYFATYQPVEKGGQSLSTARICRGVCGAERDCPPFSTGCYPLEVPRAALHATQAVPCPGDCNGDGTVGVDELVRGVGMVLGEYDCSACAVAFCNADCGPGPSACRPRIDCLVRAVRRALDGCPVDACRSDADCDDGNGCSADRCTPSGCVSDCLCV